MVGPAVLLLVAGCQRAAPPALPAAVAEAWETLPPAPCPPGMVLVEGAGQVGMRGQPYGVVSTVGLELVDRPEQGCAAAIAATPGAVTCWVQTDEVDPVLPQRAVQGQPFCVEAWPFPGPGAAYSRDGLTPWGVQQLGRALAQAGTGRRLCTYSELQLAVAGPRSNHRFVYGDGAPGERCGEDSVALPQVGADPGCASPETGVHDYGAVLSHWVLADPAFVAFACSAEGGGCVGAGNRPLAPGHPVVLGGTRRVQTRQAPLTPHTWHDHGEPDPTACVGELVWDDQPAICADPDPAWLLPPAQWSPAQRAGEATWAALVTRGRDEGSMAALLEEVLGPGWCPGG